MEIVKDINKARGQSSIDEIVEWIRAHSNDGNINKMIVVFEDGDDLVYSKCHNLRRKDRAWFLLNELNELLNGDE